MTTPRLAGIAGSVMIKKLFSSVRRPAADDGYCYLFLHIAKCAGSSIVTQLASLGSEGIHLSEKCPTKEEARKIFQDKLAKQAVSPAQIRAIYGHRVFADLSAEVPRPTRLVFLMRDPASMIVSVYNYLGTIAQDPNHVYHERERARMLDGDGRMIRFRDWIDAYAPRNLTMSFLYHAVAGELAPGDSRESLTSRHLDVCRSAVDAAHFVGFVESIAQDGPKLLQMIGVGGESVRRDNVSRKAFRLSDAPEVRDLVEERNALDCELYRHALRRWGRRASAA